MQTGSMGHFVLVTAMFGLAWLAGCEPTVAFDVDVSGQTTVEGGGLLEDLLDQFSFGDLANMDISSTAEFQNNQAEKERVSEARLTKVALTITAPEGQDFDFINEITFFVTAPGQPEREVATKAVPRGVRTFELDLADVDLAPYVRADQMSLTTAVNGRRPTEDTTIQADLVLHIIAAL